MIDYTKNQMGCLRLCLPNKGAQIQGVSIAHKKAVQWTADLCNGCNQRRVSNTPDSM
jgi:hypothetical protein